MFDKMDYGFGFGRDLFKQCPVDNCETTNDRTLLSQSDALIFHPWNMNLNDLPNIRKREQRWVFYLTESPIYSPPIIKQIPDLFNWTMTYRYSKAD
jgi:Fucosyltransferase, N-terminal